MEETTYGIISLLPVIFVIVTALITKRTLECLIIGSMVGYVILDGKGFLGAWVESAMTVFGNSAWYILVFGVFGVIIALLEKSGGAQGISQLGTKFAKTRAMSLVATWVLGILIFIDDYLNNMGVPVAMRNVTDRFKVSRELLAYIINSTGAAICVLVPISSWAVFVSGQYESLGVVGDNGTSLGAYIQSIPYMFYAWIAVIMAPLIAFKVFPLFGPMKQAELRAQAGDVFPPSYYERLEKHEIEEIPEPDDSSKNRALNFLVPMVVFVVMTIVTDGDILMGGVYTVIACGILFLPQKLMSIAEFCDTSFKGFVSMSFVTGLVLTSFILQAANERLGLTPFIIEKVEPYMSPALLPMIAFLLVAFLAFASGSFWGIIAIIAPIIIPLAISLDCNIYLVGAAIVSGTVFASHTCFYADAVTLISSTTQIQNTDYAKTAIPIAAVPVALSAILFLIFGFITM
jgi:Na+/H+ antiporter NhaC